MLGVRLPRRPLAFSLRTLIVLVGLLCAWLAWERHVVLERRAARKLLVDRGIEIGDDPDGPVRVPWIRRLFGDAPIQWLTIPTGDAVAERAASWFPEAAMWEEVGGPGSINPVTITIDCSFGPDQDGLRREAAPLNPNPTLPHGLHLPKRNPVRRP